MRSVIHEAATIAKAVEEGWRKAGKPRNFSVRIFEEPVTALFGLMTKKNAKIGIFIEDRKPQQNGQQRKHTPTRRRFQQRFDRPQQGPRRDNNQPQQQDQPKDTDDFNKE